MHNNQYTITEVKVIINAEGNIVNESVISTLLTDSRRISNAASGLFFALSARRNGHEFIAEAYAAGVRNFVVQQGPEFNLPEANFLLVDSPLASLQVLAAYHRSQFKLQVIG